MLTKEDFLTKYTQHLNEKQLQAVQSVDGPILVLAVPGSGKTTVLVNRLGYMLHVAGIAPENILTLTYTVAATADMTRRFEKIFGNDYAGQLEFRTINGICSKIITRYGEILRRDPYGLLSEEKSVVKIVRDILSKYLTEYPTESDVTGAKTLISYCKNMLLTDEEIEKLGEEEEVPLIDVYRDYNRYLKNNRLMDYDDQMVYAYRMLMHDAELLRFYQEKYRYICVDEAQDTSKIQHLIISLLAGDNGNLFMVGDEDQSIYGFRAAYPEALLNFEEEHPGAKVIVMDHNYRSNAKIVSAADAFIRHNKARHDKHMVPTRDAGADIHYIDLNTRSNQYGYLIKVAQNCTSQTAVLYRDNESALPLIDKLERQGIPYRTKSVDMAFFTHRIVTDVTNILRFAMDPKDAELFMRIYYKCRTFLRKNQAEQLCRVSRERDIPVLEAAEYVNGLNAVVRGKCKGLETNLGMMIGEVPSKALFRIEKPCGYQEYLEQNNIDGGKLYILKQLAYDEESITSFLNRLSFLQKLLVNSKPDYNCPFILSTIHSSKGLEYDRVYLMDICDGVFPNQLAGCKKSASPQEKKKFEEERRLFYVGMTRAKNDLNIFRFADATSKFISELNSPVGSDKEVEKRIRVTVEVVNSIPAGVRRKIGIARPKGVPVSDYELAIGECVVSSRYGQGVVADVTYDKETSMGRSGRFSVQFDSGEEKVFAFPLAFTIGMSLESGAKVEVRYI